MVLGMRRAYVEVHVPEPEGFAHALEWSGDESACVLAPSTSAVEGAPWLVASGLPIGTVGHRHSRFTARPRGIVIGWNLNLDEILETEDRKQVDGLVSVLTHQSHAPWVTAHAVECLGGAPIGAVSEASQAVKRTVKGISGSAILNQGLTDSRERSTAVQALTYLRDRGHRLDPDQLIVEAIRQRWPGTAPLELAKLARALNAGKQLRYQERIRPESLAQWASASA